MLHLAAIVACSCLTLNATGNDRSESTSRTQSDSIRDHVTNILTILDEEGGSEQKIKSIYDYCKNIPNLSKKRQVGEVLLNRFDPFALTDAGKAIARKVLRRDDLFSLSTAVKEQVIKDLAWQIDKVREDFENLRQWHERPYVVWQSNSPRICQKFKDQLCEDMTCDVDNRSIHKYFELFSAAELPEDWSVEMFKLLLDIIPANTLVENPDFKIEELKKQLEDGVIKMNKAASILINSSNGLVGGDVYSKLIDWFNKKENLPVLDHKLDEVVRKFVGVHYHQSPLVSQLEEFIKSCGPLKQ